MPLRPALKAHLDLNGLDSCSAPFPFASSTRVLDSPRVHFPPTPTMTSIALTHSPHAYDRAPIQVTPNTCALPERGARTYDDGMESTSPMLAECYFQRRLSHPVHSMQGWTEDGSKYSISLISPDNSNTPISSLKTFPLEPDDAEGFCGSPSSPSNAHKFGYVGSPVDKIYRCSNDDFASPYDGYNEPISQPDHADAFSLLAPNTPDSHNRSRNAWKKKKDRLQAGQAYRASYSSREGLWDGDTALEGCLGGF
ncbi:hypothetical protein BKA70DRAFT_51964 [Coprinopsis sp. MPI-PUGE-AT-0042]|nr:hypothetical protein BKA70DRAFT_51964 [Coprinopsis sp. MPI-PUGE-AT-0042]